MVAILCSANERVFSAGWDLKEVAAGHYRPDLYFDPVLGHGPGGIRRYCRELAVEQAGHRLC